tara:strand:- start:2493 stop:2915 length:423 start_codon:yes stop_codon:yes gene_type:complete
MNYKLNRRSLLQTIAGFLAFLWVKPASILNKWMGQETFSDVNPLVHDLACIFSHQESAAVVGEEYLRISPGEADPDQLLDLICCHQAEKRMQLLKAVQKERLELLKRQVRQDFEENRTVYVKRWLLSITEARLCALTKFI